MSTRSRQLLIAVLVWVAGTLAGTVNAATYHVATEADGASDDNDGLSISANGATGPWKTLSKAASLATAGDTVLIYDGDYRSEETGWGPGTIYIENSGNSIDQPIEFKVADGNEAFVDTILVHDKRWISLHGFTFINPDFNLPATWQDMPEIVVDEDIAIDFDVDFEAREPIVRQRFSTFMGIKDELQAVYSNAIDIKSSENITVKYNFIQRYAFGIQVRDNSSNITIEHNDISYCFEGIFTWQPAPSISDSVIRKNRLRQIFNNAIMVREFANNVLIENNTIHYSGTSHITVIADSTNITIRNNLARFGGYYTETMTFPGSSAINIHTSGPGNVVEGNWATDQVDLTGIDGNGFIADLMRDGASIVFRNNIALRNYGSGLRTTISPNTQILNNTFVDNGFGAGTTTNGGGIQLARDQDTDNTIQNNIFVNNNPAGIKSYRLLDDQALIDNNLYYSVDGAPLIWDGFNADERAFYTIDQIISDSGWEANGVNGSPQFVNLTAQNFHLSATSSLAIDMGASNNMVKQDLDGNNRPVGNSYDIGAYEYSNDKCPTLDLTRNLKDRTWALLSLPCGPAQGLTVNDVFADDLPGTLGTDWLLFLFDYSNNRYIKATADTRLPPGTGFWIIQTSGQTQTVDLPLNSERTPLKTPDGRCTSVRGCVELDLALIANSADSSSWRLLGNPLSAPINYGELSLSTNSGTCSDIDGCSLLESSRSSVNLSGFELWRYDDQASITEFVRVIPGEAIDPWSGFWLSTKFVSDNMGPTLHVPMPIL